MLHALQEDWITAPGRDVAEVAHTFMVPGTRRPTGAVLRSRSGEPMEFFVANGTTAGDWEVSVLSAAGVERRLSAVIEPVSGGLRFRVDVLPVAGGEYRLFVGRTSTEPASRILSLGSLRTGESEAAHTTSVVLETALSVVGPRERP